MSVGVFPWVCKSLLAAGILLTGCASSRPAEAPLVRPASSEMYAVRTGMLVVPVEVAADDLRTSPTCRLDDGRDLHARLHWVGVEPSDTLTGYRWLPDPLVWQVWPVGTEPDATPGGFWALAIELPSGAIGQGIWIDDHRVDVQWLPDPALATLDGDPMIWSPPIAASALRSPTLGRIVDPVRHSPLSRWRYRLILDGLEPDPLGEAVALDAEAPMALSDPVLEAFARQTEDLWRAAIVTLRQDDADLARRFERRLVQIVDFGDGIHAPAWPTDQFALESVRDTLLSRRSSRQKRLETIRQWLREQPAAVTWIIDDAGFRDAISGHPLASIGIVNFGRAGMLATAVDPHLPSRRDSILVLPGSAATLSVPVAPEESHPTARVEIEMGEWKAARPIHAAPIMAMPPGATIGPFVSDWTMPGWFVGVASAGVRADDRVAAAARLHRIDVSGSAPRWAIYIECRHPLDDRFDTPRPGTDWVRLWFGPRGSPMAVYRVWRDGRIVNEMAPDEPAPIAGDVVVEEDRWTCQIPIDASLIEADKTIRLGIERLDARGRRLAWPQPMLPWQIEPARATIGLDAWDGLATRD